MIEFKRKTEAELKALTPQRLKAYHKAERKRYYQHIPGRCSCGSYSCHNEWENMDDADKKVLEAWDLYCGFILAILKEKEAS